MHKTYRLATPSCARATALLILLSLVAVVYSGCSSDKQQVQIAVNAADFKPFFGPPRTIVYGPYCLNTTDTSAVVAWEEKSSSETPRHAEVELTGLSPATEYIYRVHGALQDGRVKTAPADDGSFSFLAVGDTQTGPEVSELVAAKMMVADPSASFFLHLGDMVGGPNSAQDWQDTWWAPMTDLLLQMPVYPVPGNHDEGSSYYENYFQGYRDTGRNYSFDWGVVHFIALDCNNGIKADDDTIAWLVQDLQDHQDADYIVVYHHLPVYFADSGYVTLPRKMQTILAPIYEQYGVKLVLSGHLHGYEHHLKNNIHYVISAGGGGKLSDPGEALEGVTVCQRKTYNFLRCSVEGNAMIITAYDADGNSFDSFSIAVQN